MHSYGLCMTQSASWFEQARAAHARGDFVAEAAILNAEIAANRANVPAILALAELKRQLGDERAAASYYQLALGSAAALGQVPAAWHAGLSRAQHWLREAEARFADHLTQQLDMAGIRAEDAPPRVAEALRLLRGEQPLYLQQPSMFYFPGLAQRAFFEREEFGWIAAVEAATDAIAAELAALLNEQPEVFAPYVEATQDRPPPNNPLLDKPDWGAAWLWRDGAVVPGMERACPATLAALAEAPQPVIPGRAPLALFSRLTPGTHIAPHHGMLNTRLICHLPLIVPDGCTLRVGGETRQWERGKMMIFDDSFEHEARNAGTADRIILLFEIWRPEISADERAALTTILSAMDSYEGQ